MVAAQTSRSVDPEAASSGMPDTMSPDETPSPDAAPLPAGDHTPPCSEATKMWG